jgi:hypothetical protein
VLWSTYIFSPLFRCATKSHKFAPAYKIRPSAPTNTGTDVMIFKIFSPKNVAKKLAFFAQNKAKLCKILIITLVFEKNASFFAENRQK